MQSFMDKTYYAAIYLRLSKEDGDTATGEKRESNSIANQRKLIDDYLRKHPEITKVREFCDDGYTGANFDRPEFQKMMEQVRVGTVNCVIVKDLSRFGRDYIDSGKYIEKIFPSLGVRFIAINDNYDSAGAYQAGNEIILPFKNLINDAYSRDISIKIRSNLDIKRRNGEYVGNHLVYGYRRSEEDRTRLVIDEAVAPVIQSIFGMKLDGYSPAQIAQKLNRDGVLSPYEYKRSCGSRYHTHFKKHMRTEWSAVAIHRILKNEVYTGTLVQGKTTSPNHKIKTRTMKPPSEWVRTEHAHEAIISPAIFDTVQRLMREDTRGSGTEPAHLFAGKVFCADCGRKMIRALFHYGGKEYVYLDCPGRNDGTRHRLPPPPKPKPPAKGKQPAKGGPARKRRPPFVYYRIREDAVYDAVLAVIQTQVALALDLDKALGQLDGVSWERRELERIQTKILHQEEAIEHNKELKAHLYEDFKDEVISREEYAIFKEEFDKAIREAQDAITRLTGDKNQISAGLTERQSWLSQFRAYQNIQSLTRRVVVHFVDRIEITADKQVRVILNQADQFRSITEFLDEVKRDPPPKRGRRKKEVG